MAARPGTRASDQERYPDRTSCGQRRGRQIRLAEPALSPSADHEGMKVPGLPIDQSIDAGFWIGVAAAELKPIYQRMKGESAQLPQGRGR
jgi:hypothetical protein